LPVTGATTRRHLPFLKPTDPPSISLAGEQLTTALDNDVELKTGKLSERPPASLFGKMFYVQGDATAINNGVLWVDLGTVWAVLNPPATGGQAWSASTPCENNTEYEPSLARGCQVFVNSGSSIGKYFTVWIGGEEFGRVYTLSEANAGSICFPVPAGVKFKITNSPGSATQRHILL
jgi:hypothetical protein